MNIQLIRDRLQIYACQNPLEETRALREISQELVLAALGRTDFFTKAAFHGSTSLRILYGLDRFSEDLDFALQQPGDTLQLPAYLTPLAQELTAYGFTVEIQDRSQGTAKAHIVSTKEDSLVRVLQIGPMRPHKSTRKIRIKLEVDIHPPEGAVLESRFLDFPFISSLIVHDAASLFAGKVHTLLSRVPARGRDWYDFIWYTRRGTPINHALLSATLYQQGPWQGQLRETDSTWWLEQLEKRIRLLDWPELATDVQHFVATEELSSLGQWSESFFLSLLGEYASHIQASALAESLST